MDEPYFNPDDPMDDGYEEDGITLKARPKAVAVEAAEAAPAKQRGKPFVKGHSGNPAGRPKGARNRATLLAESLLGQHAEAIFGKFIERALAGDPVPLRVCFERMLPKQQERPMLFDLPNISSPADAVKATQMIAAGVSRGELSSSEASTLIALVEASCKAFSLAALSNRIAALEESLGKKP